MDNFEDWFRWIGGLVVGGLAALGGWLHTRINSNSMYASGLHTRLAVVENRPFVDPVAHMKAITEMSGAISALAGKISMTDQARQEEFSRIYRMFERFEAVINQMEKDLSVIAAQGKQGMVR